METNPKTRNRVYAMQISRTPSTSLRNRHHQEAAEQREPHRVGEDGAGRLAVPLGHTARRQGLRTHADGAQRPAESPHDDERRKERRLGVRRIGRVGQPREEDVVDFVDDALQQHGHDGGRGELEDGFDLGPLEIDG